MPQPTTSSPPPQRRQQWRIQGQVQGVGFRPFIFRLAQTYGLTGSVRNEDSDVIIEAQGNDAQLAAFEQALQTGPSMARVDRIVTSPMATLSSAADFQITPSTSSTHFLPQSNITPDLAVCPDCQRELLAGSGRHRLAGYPLINCTHCGPRYSIVRRTPYDRANTTMSVFSMCPQCRAEYDDPAHRRFHAQPIACDACGPHLRLVTHLGEPVAGDPIAAAVRLLEAGQILAIKGLGGFHLAVRATDHAAVARLRQLKQRDAKPFAIMCASLAATQRLVDLSAAGAAALVSPVAPIVLASQRPNHGIAPAVAPGTHRLGVMLPYTPIQHLLFASGSGGAEEGSIGGGLVMTSANHADEPLIIDNDDALKRLGSLCDALLLHDRPIQRPADDSIVLDLSDDDVLPIRRARGFVPTPITLPDSLRHAPAGLCLGGELKNTIAVVTHGQAILSQHLGDLRHPRAYTLFQQTIRDLLELLVVQPRWIAHDLHPLYLSTQYATELARQWNVPLVPVQHHHAHAAALMAENNLEGPILAIVCDGTGYPPHPDTTIWGGELLLADWRGFRRLAHLRPLLLPGGDAASVDTRRPALAAL
ncbi:MAG: carbamoyltransferase HypF, partial [Phycisphaerae bacterium]